MFIETDVVTVYYVGPTATKGARIIAKGLTKKLTVPYLYETTLLGNFRYAAMSYFTALNFKRSLGTHHLVGGAVKPKGMCFVLVPKSYVRV